MPTHVCHCPKGPYLTGQECPDCRDMSARERRLVEAVREYQAAYVACMTATCDDELEPAERRYNRSRQPLFDALAAYDPKPES